MEEEEGGRVLPQEGPGGFWSCLGGLSLTPFSVAGSPCLSSPCQNEGTCVESDSPEGFACSCLGGYAGPLCEEMPLEGSPTSAPMTSGPMTESSPGKWSFLLSPAHLCLFQA